MLSKLKQPYKTFTWIKAHGTFNIILGDDSHQYCVTVCSGTYPCISFRRQRISHPGAEPGPRRLDGDGITDARQFATCCKERSEIGTSRATPIWVFKLIQSLSQGFHFNFLWIQMSLPEWWGSGCPACCYDSAFLFAWCTVQEVLIIQFTHPNVCFTLSVWICEKVRGRGNRKGRASVYSAPVCCL